MTIRTLLQRRKSGTYYIRKKVPVHLRAIIGKSEIVKSLGTNKYNDAIYLLFTYECAIMSQLNQLAVNTSTIPLPPEIHKNRVNIMNHAALASVTAATNNSTCYKASEAFELLKKRNQLSKSTTDEYTKVIGQFIEVHGDLPLDGFKKKDIKDFITIIKTIGRIPKGKEYQDKTVNELYKLVTTDKIKDRKPLAHDTLTKKLTAISSMFNMAVQDDFIEHNPAHGITITKDDTAEKQKRLPFSIDNLNCIFSSPLFKGCKSQMRRRDHGDMIIKDEKFWMPLMGLFTGARLNEMGQLHLTDIKQDNNIWYLSLTDAGELQTLKSDTSKRNIPIHNELIRMGLLEYVNDLNNKGEKKLFPSLVIKQSKDSVSSKISNWINNYLTDIGIKKDVNENETKSFHM